VDQYADYFLLREPVFAESSGVCAAGADLGGGGVCGGGGAGLCAEGGEGQEGEAERGGGGGEVVEVLETVGEGLRVIHTCQTPEFFCRARLSCCSEMQPIMRPFASSRTSAIKGR